MVLLSDQIQEFIDWLKEMTEFGDWNESIQIDVHKKLIECMISVPAAAPPERVSEGKE